MSTCLRLSPDFPNLRLPYRSFQPPHDCSCLLFLSIASHIVQRLLILVSKPIIRIVGISSPGIAWTLKIMDTPKPNMPPGGSTPLPSSATHGAGPKKRRRIHLNCEECRRTKSRCETFPRGALTMANAIGNRSWPCSECVKKGG